MKTGQVIGLAVGGVGAVVGAVVGGKKHRVLGAALGGALALPALVLVVLVSQRAPGT